MASSHVLLTSIFLLFAVKSLWAVPADGYPVAHVLLTVEQNALQANGFTEKCSMGNNTWQCCVGAEFKFNVTVCTVLEYLPDEYGILAKLTVDDVAVVSYKLSAKNPPPICAYVPYLEKLANVCIRFYDLDESESKFRGCAQLEGNLEHFQIFKLDIGCFEIPLKFLRRAKNFQRIDYNVQHANRIE